MFSWSARVCSIIIWILAAANLAAQPAGPSPDYGLSFASHEVTKDQRTSLNLTPAEPFRFHDDFSIAFDVSYQRLTNAFGYILRVIANDSLNIDLVSSPEHSEFYDLNLIISDMPVSIHYDFSEAGVKPLQWNTVMLTFSYTQRAITLTWNGKAKTVAFPLNKLEAFRFVFGANDYSKFNTSDVPPIALRDITLTQAQKPCCKKVAAEAARRRCGIRYLVEICGSNAESCMAYRPPHNLGAPAGIYYKSISFSDF